MDTQVTMRLFVKNLHILLISLCKEQIQCFQSMTLIYQYIRRNAPNVTATNSPTIEANLYGNIRTISRLLSYTLLQVYTEYNRFVNAPTMNKTHNKMSTYIHIN